MQSIVGILTILGCVFGGFLLHGGSLKVIWQPVELLIIIGAGVGAIILGNPVQKRPNAMLGPHAAWLIDHPGPRQRNQLAFRPCTGETNVHRRD